MARSASTGRYVRRRTPRAGGTRRAPRILDADFSRSKEVGGVLTGEPIELGGGQTIERKSTTTTKATTSTASA